MPQGGKRKRSGGSNNSRNGSRKVAQAEAKRRRKAGSKLKVGNPVRGVKKTGRFEMKMR